MLLCTLAVGVVLAGASLHSTNLQCPGQRPRSERVLPVPHIQMCAAPFVLIAQQHNPCQTVRHCLPGHLELQHFDCRRWQGPLLLRGANDGAWEGA